MEVEILLLIAFAIQLYGMFISKNKIVYEKSKDFTILLLWLYVILTRQY